jgi:hypothetical protein
MRDAFGVVYPGPASRTGYVLSDDAILPEYLNEIGWLRPITTGSFVRGQPLASSIRLACGCQSTGTS